MLYNEIKLRMGGLGLQLQHGSSPQEEEIVVSHLDSSRSPARIFKSTSISP